MLAMILPTYRSGSPDGGRAVWADLRVCLHAVEAYAVDLVDEVVVAWDGPFAPDGMPEHPKIRYLHRPPRLDHGDALIWTIEQTEADELIQTGDDVVLHPDTIPFLLEDVALLERERTDLRIGTVGARSNFIHGPQNVRWPNGGQLHPLDMAYSSESKIIQTDKIITVLCWYRRAAWEEVGRFPKGLLQFGDILYSYDLRKAGYSLFVSRAYVHHVGGSHGIRAFGGDEQSWYHDAVQWTKANRPDFLPWLVENGYVPQALADAP